MDYLLMLSNPACEAFIDEKKTLCGKPAIRILDFDTATTTEQLPVCGDLCELSSTEIIVREASERGRIPALGVNGWGRGRMQDGVTS
jgi:hypothetical protein